MKRFFSLISILLFVSVFIASAQDAKPEPKAALVIIDIQYFYFEKGTMPLVGSIEASLKAKKLLEKFRKENKTVIHVQHLPQKALEANPLFAIHENVKPLDGEKIIQKRFINSFKETDLLEYLQQKGVKRLVLCGMQTHMCLEAATRAGADYGFECAVVEDACATRDLQYKDKLVKAHDVHYGVLATLNGIYAKITDLETFLKDNER